MVIELAGVPAAVHCRYDRNIDFLKEYESGREPWFEICPEDRDLLRIREELDRAGFHGSEEDGSYSGAFLENNAIHALLAHRLLDYDVLLVHGAALCMEGKAYIFTGRSGTGKSTHAGIWRKVFGDRVRMINDDKPLVRFTDEGVIVYGSPWRGKHRLGENTSAPLKAVLSLRQGMENQIRPMKRAEAFSAMMKQAMRTEDPAGMEKIVELEMSLTERIAFFDMECNMEPGAALTAYERVRLL